MRCNFLFILLNLCPTVEHKISDVYPQSWWSEHPSQALQFCRMMCLCCVFIWSRSAPFGCPRSMSCSLCSVPLSCSADTAHLQQLWCWEPRPGCDSFLCLERCTKGVGPWIFERKHNMFLSKVLLQLSRNCRVRL